MCHSNQYAPFTSEFPSVSTTILFTQYCYNVKITYILLPGNCPQWYFESLWATACTSESCPLGVCVPCARFVNLFLRFVPQEHWLQNSAPCFQVIILHLCSRSGTDRRNYSICSWRLDPVGKNRLKSLDDRTLEASRRKPQIRSAALHTFLWWEPLYTLTVCRAPDRWWHQHLIW